MDLFAKDHPLEAAALREKIAKSRLRSFVFEELPHAVRHRIYRELLLKPNHDDSQSEAEYLNEHDKIRDRIMNLKVEFWRTTTRCTQRSCVPKRRSTKKPLLFCTRRIGSHGISLGAYYNRYGTGWTTKQPYVLVDTVALSRNCTSWSAPGAVDWAILAA